MPTFGRTDTTGCTASVRDANVKVAQRQAGPGALWVPVSITAYLDGLGSAGSGSQNLRFGLYSDKAGPLPDALQCVTSDTSIPYGTAAGWVTLNFTTNPSLGASGYWWITFHTGATANVIQYYRQTTGGTAGYETAGDLWTDGMENPFGAMTSATVNIAMYVTYNLVGTQHNLTMLKCGTG